MGEIIHSIFDHKDDFEPIPVIIHTGFGKKIVGSASLTQTSDGVHVSMDLETDDEELIKSFLGGGLKRGDYSSRPGGEGTLKRGGIEDD